ncbi:MAG: SDR family NAD(P)-dependent oxidoreductase [Chloroflexaceae bacterium]|nr:SDR family NAD(P)-dependent oxidoreductase [Chloroflexaceae bacterium]
MSTPTPSGLLAGKIAIITGGAGNIGQVITRRYLEEGATVVIADLFADKLHEFHQTLMDEEHIAADRVLTAQMDGSDMKQVRSCVADIIARLGRVDILVNNAGSPGPRQRLDNIPMIREELVPPDNETLRQAIGNLLGIIWNPTRAVAPHMPPGSSIINVSTIFSRTDYYGRIAYVVPKAAVNSLDHSLSQELGVHGIRVNTIYPGPIDSQRIRSVFESMDKLKGLPGGSTAQEFFDIMALRRPNDDGELVQGFPKTLDVANTMVFLGSDLSMAFSDHAFEVTNGMDVPVESATTLVSRPGLRNVDASGKMVLVCAGDQVDDALALMHVLRSCGAEVVLGFRDRSAIARAEQVLRENRQQDLHYTPPTLVYMNPLEPESTEAALAKVQESVGVPQYSIILPTYSSEAFASSTALATADDEIASRFMDEEIVGVVAMASQLDRFWRKTPVQFSPHVIFMTNGDDGQGNKYADMWRAAVEQLIRVWRHETKLDAAKQAEGDSAVQPVWANQIVRYTNQESGSLEFGCAWAAKLIISERRVDEINLYLPANISITTGTGRPSFGWAESLFGLHLGKVAMITGGSAGIGGQVGRLLALSGASVMLAARGEAQLTQMRESLIQEVRQAGYVNPEQRVQIFPDCDVSREEDLQRLTDHTLATFGRIDYLINNAGIAGAEEMLIDMPLDAWRHTLNANLISNYSLIRKVAPLMKSQGSGYILNVSSYFGGEKYVAIPYPNRSDYAVSKAGQRAMVESFARFLGPEVQINAIAPGPVDGDRLRGTGERPGLFMRRARLILENRRLNDVHGALVEAYRATKQPVAGMLRLLTANDVHILSRTDHLPSLRQLANAIEEQSDPQSTSRTYLLNETIAQKLVRRLRLAGYISDADVESWQLERHPPDPFFTKTQIEREARKVRDGVVGMLYLHRMPTEFDVAIATVYYLADHNVTGETFHPSGGLRFERTVTEGELFGRAGQHRLAMLRDSTVFVVGESLVPYLTELARAYLDEYGSKRVVLITETEEGAEKLLAGLPDHAADGRLVAIPSHGTIEDAIDRARATYGDPGPVISSPFRSLPSRSLTASSEGEWGDVLSESEFGELIEDHLTHHFRVAQKISLIDGATLVLVTTSTSARSTLEEFAMSNFIKTTLHAFTATVGVESERIVHHVPVNQVDLTRRSRAEEPRNAAEETEEIERFVNAVLLVTAPLPDPKDSRYRSRIYRGNAIIV